ncbi:MAG: hemolysin family protein [Gammaproteobacteria bacterium]|nr:hemolysin family protein [Gammaproteobacteria bacterium]NNL44714.1 HlyC/CorC family transporter [Woeseiaceae bacterium]
MFILVTAITVALVVSFLCSIFESVLLSIRPAQIELLVSSGRRSGRLLKSFKERIDVPIAAILIVNTVAHTIGATVAGASYVDVYSEQSLWVFSAVFTVAVLLFTEIIPKTLGVTFANVLARPVAHAIHWLTLLLGPLVTLASKVSRAIRGSKEIQATSIEEIRLMTAIGRQEGVVGARTAGIIVRATRLHQLRAADVLVPRQQVVALTKEQSPEDVMRTIRQSGHSRFPFTPTGRLDDASGVVLAKELLLSLQDDPDVVDWPTLIREPLIIMETIPLNSLLQAFRAAQQHMAIVVDEYGGTEGIVTLEDVLEELVGEIIDESDRPVDELWPQTDGAVHALSTIELLKLTKHLGIPWRPNADIHTLGGLLSSRLERIPRKGDAITWNGYRVKVLSATETRAEVVRLEHIPGGATPE